jgi:hypothetical protein
MRFSFIFSHRPLWASLFELRPNESLEPQRSQRIKYFSFAVERTANEKLSALTFNQSPHGNILLIVGIKAPQGSFFLLSGLSPESKK